MNKRFSPLFLALILFFNLSLVNCQATISQNQPTTISETQIPDKVGMTVKGIILDDSNHPVQGIVVNDGTNFTATDNNGFYYLPTDLSRGKYVSISIPAKYEIEKDVPSSFYSKLTYGKEVNRRDFKLNLRKISSDEFTYIAISDPQVKNTNHLERFEKETIADLKEILQQLNGKEVYAMTLGDNVFDVMGLFPLYKTQLSSLHIPVFSTIGNHDYNLKYNNLHNTTNPLENYAEEVYESYFGPTDYSFNIGKVHVITMSNIDYSANKMYKERFTAEQFEWLKKDLGYVKTGTTVFLNVHAPTSNKSSNGSGNSSNTAELLEIFKNYPLHIFSGHTHFYENEEPSATVYDHNIGAVCGAWWAGTVNRCGTPNGYLVVDVKGNDVKWHYKSTGKELSYQFRVYKTEEFTTQADYVVANVWDWDSHYQVKCYEDGVLKGSMEQFSDEDQDFITMKNGVGTGYKTLHLFRTKPSKDTKNVKIEVTNRFGEVYTQSIVL